MKSLPSKAGVCIGFHEDGESGIFFFSWGKSLMVGGKGEVSVYMSVT